MNFLLTALVAAVVALLTVTLALANRRSADAERLASLERKVEQVMNHLDLAPPPIAANPTPFRVTDPLSAQPPLSTQPPLGGVAVANSLSATVIDLVRRGKKIEAIKVYRDQTGVGLKEAKDAVERIERGGA